MNTLYLIHLSSGLPRERKFRRNWTIVCTGATQVEAKAKTVREVMPHISPEKKVRVEQVEAICRTPDSLIRGALN